MGFMVGSGNQYNHPTKAERLKDIEKLMAKLGLEPPPILYSLRMKELYDVYIRMECAAIEAGLRP